ncbi:CDP-glycerol glycerophosphotransferase family protein [Clostridium botulinum]|uniref:CDP-glycerol glycerophosphotransferase family protein n=1 Tax=Clostridium botulinum TaxID=1491 RepID=UPI000774A498|nr:CDP-glycerol glycerophosphotransferase family protein [Clostridium botulinum]
MKKKIKKIIKKLIIGVYNIVYYILPINEKIIMFESSVGRNYTGNPKAIYEEIVNQKLDYSYKCIWILENTNQKIPGNCKKVKRLRLAYFYYMIRSKFWVMDSRQPSYLKKKKGNVYIQTWHGTPLKKLGLDMTFVNMSGYSDIKEYRDTFRKNSSRWDYLISQNEYSTRIFKHAFNFNKNILEVGYPRNDILFNNNFNDLENMKKDLGIQKDKKVILYAPTWRDNQYSEDGRYKFILPIDLDKFIEKFSKEYVLILKPHYLVADKIDISKYKENVKICGIDWDIQQLYLISDILITDYSSVMFDYSILKKPIIFYMYDLKEYTDEIREFYFNILKEAPGQITLNNTELMEAIENIDELTIKYNDKYTNFCKKYSSIDSGDASKKIINIIQSGK